MLCEFYAANCDPLLTGIKYIVDCLSDNSDAKSDKDKTLTWLNSLNFSLKN